ncbi:MAG: carbon monoxide dehydrogenase [Tissierellia bacterium]|nr:carbon monoxide dehydrogenase [Tissierellia bacterium]
MFYSPKNSSELLDILKFDLSNTYFIAGGTDLAINIKNHKLVDYDIIDLTKINEFHQITEDEKNVYIGAICTMTEICENELIKKHFYSVYRSAYELGSDIIRNGATIGGNIGNASQSADVVLALFAHNGKIEIMNSNGEVKILPISEVILGRNKTCLNKNEVISRIIIEKRDIISTFRKVGARKAVTISKVSCATVLKIVENTIQEANIYLGAIGTKAKRANLLEDYFLGKSLEELEISELQKLAYDEVELAIPDRDSRYYKRVAIEGLIEDVYKDLVNYERI